MSDTGYYDDTLRWRRGGTSQNVVASAARTTTGTGTAFPRAGTTAVVTVVVTAIAGTPTLMPRLEGRMADGTWVTLGQAAANITGTGTTRFVCLLAGQAIRPAWTIGGGTPSLTFTVDVEQYA